MDHVLVCFRASDFKTGYAPRDHDVAIKIRQSLRASESVPAPVHHGGKADTEKWREEATHYAHIQYYADANIATVWTIILFLASVVITIIPLSTIIDLSRSSFDLTGRCFALTDTPSRGYTMPIALGTAAIGLMLLIGSLAYYRMMSLTWNFLRYYCTRNWSVILAYSIACGAGVVLGESTSSIILQATAGLVLTPLFIVSLDIVSTSPYAAQHAPLRFLSRLVSGEWIVYLTVSWAHSVINARVCNSPLLDPGRDLPLLRLALSAISTAGWTTGLVKLLTMAWAKLRAYGRPQVSWNGRSAFLSTIESRTDYPSIPATTTTTTAAATAAAATTTTTTTVQGKGPSVGDTESSIHTGKDDRLRHGPGNIEVVVCLHSGFVGITMTDQDPSKRQQWEAVVGTRTCSYPYVYEKFSPILSITVYVMPVLGFGLGIVGEMLDVVSTSFQADKQCFYTASSRQGAVIDSVFVVLGMVSTVAAILVLRKYVLMSVFWPYCRYIFKRNATLWALAWVGAVAAFINSGWLVGASRLISGCLLTPFICALYDVLTYSHYTLRSRILQWYCRSSMILWALYLIVSYLRSALESKDCSAVDSPLSLSHFIVLSLGDAAWLAHTLRLITLLCRKSANITRPLVYFDGSAEYINMFSAAQQQGTVGEWIEMHGDMTTSGEVVGPDTGIDSASTPTNSTPLSPKACDLEADPDIQL